MKPLTETPPSSSGSNETQVSWLTESMGIQRSWTRKINTGLLKILHTRGQACVIYQWLDKELRDRVRVGERQELASTFFLHFTTEEETCTPSSPQTDFLSACLFKSPLSLDKKKKKKKGNIQKQKQPTQETAFNLQETQRKINRRKQQRKQSKYRFFFFLTCHMVPWASFFHRKPPSLLF